MEKRRKIQILSIVALMFAIVGMSVGFAAFSATLNISSSATVTTSTDGFVIKLYGFVGDSIVDISNINKYTSTTFSNIGIVNFSNEFMEFIPSKADIDNSTLSISIGDVLIEEPSYDTYTIIRVKNEGNFDAYFDSTKFPGFGDKNGVCIPEEGTTASLVEEVCPYIYNDISVYSFDVMIATMEYLFGTIQLNEYSLIVEQDNLCHESGICKLAKGEEMFLTNVVGYATVYKNGEEATPRADGPFSVIFPDFKLEFTSSSAGYEE